jgi:hypothetical protein
LSRQPSGAVTSIGRKAPAEGGSVGVGQDPYREERRRFRHRERAVEVPLHLRVGAGEVEGQLVAGDCRHDAQGDVTRLAAGVVLEHVLGGVGPVGQGGHGGAGAALGVGEDLVHPGAQQPGAVALGELGQAQGTDPVGGALGAQVGEPLLRKAHLRGEVAQPLRAGRRRGDDDALFRERPRVGGHAAGGRPADVRVMGAAGGEADRRPLDEDR